MSLFWNKLTQFKDKLSIFWDKLTQFEDKLTQIWEWADTIWGQTILGPTLNTLTSLKPSCNVCIKTHVSRHSMLYKPARFCYPGLFIAQWRHHVCLSCAWRAKLDVSGNTGSLSSARLYTYRYPINNRSATVSGVMATTWSQLAKEITHNPPVRPDRDNQPTSGLPWHRNNQPTGSRQPGKEGK